MSRQHLIDHAEFDTTYSAGVLTSDQQSDLDAFIQSDLIRVIEEVFDDIDRQADNRDAVLRLEQLEINLGAIDYQDYRQQLPQRLRRELRQALDSACYPTTPLQPVKPRRNQAYGDAAVLFYFLRHGRLPGSASVGDIDMLEALLQRIIDTNPAPLIELIGTEARNDAIMERITTQFSAAAATRVMRLLESRDTELGITATPSATLDQKASINERRAQLLTALVEGKQAQFERLWQRLMKDEREMLSKILRHIGQLAINRRKLVERLSPRQFNQLLQLLEPVAFEFLLLVLDHRQWLSMDPGHADAEATASENRLGEYLLGYLLVERDVRFNREDFIESLLRQIAQSSLGQPSGYWPALTDRLQQPAQTAGVTGELARLMLALAERLSAETGPGASINEDYRRYARVAAMFTPGVTKPDEIQALGDIDALQQQAPWLLQRLLRELQTGGGDWRSELRKLGRPAVEKTVYAFLSLINQSVASAATEGSADLVAVIRRHSEHARSPQAYFADILLRLITDDVIDFDEIGVVETDGPSEDETVERFAFTESVAEHSDALDDLSPMGMRAMQLLQAAELLTTSSLATSLALPAHQLQAIKWRLIKTYTRETGYLFNLGQFVRVYIEALVDQAGISDPGQFYSLLGQALLQNNLSATHELTREIIEQLDDIAAEISPPPGTNTVQTAATDDLFDDTAPEEDIHIANAGLVLLAPWLPRLFQQLDFIKNGEFVNHDTAERAVHCLQFLVDAKVTSPEYRLVLNKLLCGVKPGKPIRRQIELTDAETGSLESLLEAITQHWKALENTSVDGLRESFLLRGGRLQRRQDAWHLAVEARPFDMLLEQVPWSFSTIKFAWMDRVIYVDWR